MADQIRYDLLTQQALRGVVRAVLSDAAKKGLPGDHHFFITFDTHADGVKMSERLRAQHPKDMTIILQHQFWDLVVNDYGFEVGLSFGGITERLAIPFEAINGFFDPSVQFGLQFEEVTEGQSVQTPANGQDRGQDRGLDKSAKKKRFAPSALSGLAGVPEKPAPAPPALAAVPDAKTDPKPDKPSGGGEVVRLDRFRKK
ncbi:MAG: ClpXP protease specificity-enhancing factor SspB [Pseudolabrys sp.]